MGYQKCPLIIIISQHVFLIVYKCDVNNIKFCASILLGFCYLIIMIIVISINDTEKSDSILIVEEKIDYLRDFANKIYVLESGRIVLNGNCSEILNSKEALLSAYVG